MAKATPTYLAVLAVTAAFLFIRLGRFAMHVKMPSIMFNINVKLVRVVQTLPRIAIS
jgi:hypothetical protein